MSRRMEERAELNLFVERFRRDGLPAELWPLFQARFVEQLDQREAARRLGMPRTTLAYRELRVKRLLRAFLRKRSRP
jgi:RNA polymerase sigma-70 factor, ECF subfamily